MKILLTGASSFTGFHFASHLATAGHEVTCPLTRRSIQRYGDVRHVRWHRLNKLSGKVDLVFNAQQGTRNFFDIFKSRDYDLFCHHGAAVSGYKLPNFNPVAAVADNMAGFGAVLDHVKAVVTTGTIAEPGEGGPDAMSAYGVSKAATWMLVKHLCEKANKPIAKFVISNPFGPYEEPDRFCATAVRSWKAGEPVSVVDAGRVRDNIHVKLLAEAYVKACEMAAWSESRVYRPLGTIETWGHFVERFASEMGQRMNFKSQQTIRDRDSKTSEPRVRTNSDPVRVPYREEESILWDEIAEFYRDLPQ